MFVHRLASLQNKVSVLIIWLLKNAKKWFFFKCYGQDKFNSSQLMNPEHSCFCWHAKKVQSDWLSA